VGLAVLAVAAALVPGFQATVQSIPPAVRAQMTGVSWRPGCPVPIVMAGGKKLPELDALTMAYNAVQEGAAGVDMGRNIFQSDAPRAMLEAVRAVVHKTLKPKEGFELYQSLKAKG